MYDLNETSDSIMTGVYANVVEYFHHLLSRHAVFLFLDSVHELNDDNQG